MCEALQLGTAAVFFIVIVTLSSIESMFRWIFLKKHIFILLFFELLLLLSVLLTKGQYKLPKL